MVVSVKKASKQDYNRITNMLSIVQIPMEIEDITYFLLEKKKNELIGVIGIRKVVEHGKTIGQLRPLVLTKECTEENFILLIETIILFAKTAQIDELNVLIHNRAANSLFRLLDFELKTAKSDVDEENLSIILRKCINIEKK